MTRHEAYERLARELGQEVHLTHIGYMWKDEAESVVQIVKS